MHKSLLFSVLVGIPSIAMSDECENIKEINSLYVEATSTKNVFSTKRLQQQLGVTADGIWGRKSEAAYTQARSHNDAIKIGETTRGRKIQVESAGFNAGSKSSIKLDDIELSLSKRGINLVVFNENQEITYHFDTHGS